MQDRIKQNINGEIYYDYSKKMDYTKILAVIGAISIIAVVVLAGIGVKSVFSSAADSMNSGKSGSTAGEEALVEKIVISESDVKHQMSPIAELTTFEDTYHGEDEIVDYSQLWGWDVPLTKHTIKYKYEGTIKVSYEIKNIDVRVDNENQVIYITLPEPEVDNQAENTGTTDENNNLINNIKSDEVQQRIDNEIEPARLKEAEEKGLYNRAEQNAINVIESQLRTFEKEGYSVEFID